MTDPANYLPDWYGYGQAAEAERWALAPTTAQKIRADIIAQRKGHEPDETVFKTWRFRYLCMPLLHLIDWIVGPEKRSLAAYLQAGRRVMKAREEFTFERDALVTHLYGQNRNVNKRASKLDREVRELATRAHHAEEISRAITRFARTMEKEAE